ncbi:aspartic peptidase domain-containing protein [Spinellus fusiger]|nr:aspartic peptidase domain-containing protein [Spinellus fusiger]
MHIPKLYLVVLFPLLVSVTAHSEHYKIPLYRRTFNPQNGIVQVAGRSLDSGVLAGKLYIGTPPQEFTVAFDTTTGYSWVRGYRCTSDNCLNRCTYYARRSSTVVPTGQKFSVDYGSSCVDTHVYLDTFQFANLTVPSMPFGGAYRMHGFDPGFDGYLGLGRSVDFNTTKLRTTSSRSLSKRGVSLPDSAFVANAYQQGSGVQSAQFGIDDGFSESGAVSMEEEDDDDKEREAPASMGEALHEDQPAEGLDPSLDVHEDNEVVSGGYGFTKRHGGNAVVRASATPQQEQVAGYLVLGGVDESAIQGPIEYIPLANTEDHSAKNWDVCIRDANFDGELNMKQLPNAIASISTANSMIVMPPKQADQFHATFGGRYNAAEKNYRFVCCEAEKLPTLKLTLENHIVELPSKYWIKRLDQSKECCGYCTTRISHGNSDRDWVLGTAFTNAFYVTFDPEGERIGLALRKGHKEDGLRVYRKSH